MGLIEDVLEAFIGGILGGVTGFVTDIVIEAFIPVFYVLQIPSTFLIAISVYLIVGFLLGVSDAVKEGIGYIIGLILVGYILNDFMIIAGGFLSILLLILGYALKNR